MRARLIVSVLAGLFVVGGCAGTGTPAATVNGDDIDRSTVADLIETVQSGDDPAFAAQFEPVPGVFPAEFASQILTVLIQDQVLSQAVEELDLEVTDEDIADARAQGQSSGFDEIDELSSRVTANAIAVGDIAPFFAEAEVKVDPRYGVWDSTRAQVVPPAFADQVG
ncbi:MAG: SurA N-terminal domain-containing protein [Acidimicrobiales bacterium]